uniref:Glutathione S-transferase n=1 Tax=Panagrolaimus sp. JU765 TaxID=591449 RepID=A0AC34RRA4_9BILA
MVYKLYYFDVRYYGETARMLLTAAGEKFEDVTWNLEEWQNQRKKESPTGKAPWLEVDGHVIPESFAIYRFLANRFGYAGKDEFEKALALVDSTADFFREGIKSTWDYFLVNCGWKEGDKDKLYKEGLVPALDAVFAYVKKQVDKSGSGFIAPSGLTWVDLFIAENVMLYLDGVPDFEKNYPFAVEYQKRVHSYPKIKDYAESRKNVRTGYVVPPKN